MADRTGIQWTDATWNPLAGCSIVSPACTNCYAMAQAARIVRCAKGAKRDTHYADTVTTVKGKPVWTGEIRMAPDHVLTQPLRWRRPRRIFVNSMSDLFHEAVPDEWIDKIFAVMALAPQHTFQVLTKRPERMRAYMLKMTRHAGDLFNPLACLRLKAAAEHVVRNQPENRYPWVKGWPMPNVWLGVTAERQQEADERIPILLDTPAARRFVSIEPMLGAVDLNRVRRDPSADDRTMPLFDQIDAFWINSLDGQMGFRHPANPYHQEWWNEVESHYRIDWVICGGESGPCARPMHPDWARSLRDQCAAAGVPFFFKQWGEWVPLDQDDGGYWPDDTPTACRLRIDGSRGTGGWPMQRVGKASAGHLLDGVEHHAFPEG